MKRLRAFSLVRQQPHYRHEAFLAGLKAAGYEAMHGQPWWPARPGDLLVIWNRHSETDAIARRFEAEGGVVLVAENGYIGHDENGIQLYALAVGGHNGSGIWPLGDGSRWAKLASSNGIELKPWREPGIGGFVYIRGQRGIGTPLMASPPAWHDETARALRKLTNRAVHVRPHPGKPACDPNQAQAIAQDLEGAQACVIWASGAGVRALVEGVPVFWCAPFWICAGAGRHGIERIEDPMRSDELRLAALERMAWAQWTVAELAGGEPFRLLAECAVQTSGRRLEVVA